jgi:hypothetical protein
MRIFHICLAIFIFYGAASAQFIFIPFEGEWQLATIEDMKKENVDVSKLGKPCGKYFLYEEAFGSDNSVQKILTFKVSISKEEKKRGAESLVRSGLKILGFEFNDELKSPTAAWKKGDAGKGKMILRISRADYEAAECLPKSD